MNHSHTGSVLQHPRKCGSNTCISGSGPATAAVAGGSREACSSPAPWSAQLVACRQSLTPGVLAILVEADYKIVYLQARTAADTP